MSKISFALICAVVLLVGFVLYRSSLNYYFFQDDFFHLNISRAANFKEFLEFFKFRNDIIGYRPVSLQLYFFFPQKLFELDPGGFRIISFSLLFSSFFLIIKIFKKISGQMLIGFLTATLWIISSIHFMTITWVSAGYIIIGTFFWLFTSYLFLKFISEKKKIYYVFTVISFVATLASNEFSVTWPFIFGFYYYFILRNSLKKSVKIFVLFLFFLIMYLSARLFFMKVPSIPEYKLDISFSTVKTLFWYFLWTFNIPEEFKKQIVGNVLSFNPKFLSEYKVLVIETFSGAIAVVFLGIIYPLLKTSWSKILENKRIIIFSLVWFLVAISPVLLLPNHTFTMYLALPSIGLYLLVSYLTVNFSSKKLILPILLIWVATSYITLSFYKVNSWMVEAQRFAGKFETDLKEQMPVLPKKAVVLYYLSDHRHLQALLNQQAVRSIYQDGSLSIYYNKEDLLADKKALEGRPIYIFIQK